MENGKITVIDERGKEAEANVLLYFKIDKNEKEYVLYSFGELDEQAMETIHASVLSKENDTYKLDKINDDEWLEVKDIMREIIRNEEETKGNLQEEYAKLQNAEQIKAIYDGDNKVKITGSMREKLIAFSAMLMEIAYNTNKINELNAIINGKDKRAAIKAIKERQSLKKENNKLQANLQKVIVNLTGVEFVKNKENEAIQEIQPEVENNKAEGVTTEKTDPENSLSDELNDLFTIPEAPVQPEQPSVEITPEPEVETQPVETPEKPAVQENTEVEQKVEEPIVSAELPQINVTEIEPEMDNKTVEAETSEEPTAVAEPTMETTDITPDYNFDQPVIPASDEEIEKSLENAEETKADDSKEKAEENISITPEDIAAIDDIVNGNYKLDDYGEVQDESEEKDDDLDNDIFSQMPSTNPETNDSSVEDKSEENESDSHEVFVDYKDWMYSFAENIYGKNSFTREELEALETKPGFISEKEFNESRTNQLTELKTERDNLKHEKSALIVELNASKTLADRVTSELGELKGEHEKLQKEHNSTIAKLNDTKASLKDTKENLKSTQKTLAEKEKELAEAVANLEAAKAEIKNKNKKIEDYKGLVQNAFSVLSDMDDSKENKTEEEGYSKSMGKAA